MINPRFHRSVITKFLCFAITCLVTIQSANAAHLVGGEISYICLGGNEYRIKLRIYRDCAGGGAQFDSNAAIAIYDSAGNLIDNLMVPKGSTVAVPADSTGNPCVSAPPGLCTEYAEYIDTVELPPVSGGYVISHQRCCRNSSISNVLNSGDFGNTYTVSVPSNDTLCNSSPQFNGVAPIVLCLNEEFNLPMDVTEADGDSLHFELCDVLNGGGQVGGTGCNAVIPNPPCAPPYTPISFAPPFTSSSPMPSNPAVSLDPNTGLLIGKPDQVGQYLVGICVTEYRNGIPLSTVRLDYQFNITNCIVNVVSDMVTPTEEPSILCDGLLVQFESESQNATKLLWNFGDPSSLTDTSSSPTPSYFYNLPGRYNVRLIANPGLPCSDTTIIPFDVRHRLKPEFDFDGVFCFEAQDVQFNALGSYPSTATFEWDFGPNANFPIVMGKQPPSISWSSPGKHYVSLTVTDKGCTETHLDSVMISNLSVGVDAGPDQNIRRGQVIDLAATGGTQYYWFSDHPVDFSNPWGQNTSAELREDGDTVKFYVRVFDPLGCEGIDSMRVFVSEGEGPINYFTPNDDGKNDVFDLSDLNPDNDCHLSILNRWGSEVYYEDDYDNNWKGVRRGGQDLPDGTYYYILMRDGELVWKDAVTIMRN